MSTAAPWGAVAVKPCPDCKGRGEFTARVTVRRDGGGTLTTPCDTCRGRGKIRHPRPGPYQRHAPRLARAARLNVEPHGSTEPNRKKKQVKLLFTAAGAVLAVLALTSSAFAHAHSREKWIAAALIIGVFTLVGFVASRARRPAAPEAPSRPVYPFSGTGTRR